MGVLILLNQRHTSSLGLLPVTVSVTLVNHEVGVMCFKVVDLSSKTCTFTLSVSTVNVASKDRLGKGYTFDTAGVNDPNMV